MIYWHTLPNSAASADGQTERQTVWPSGRAAVYHPLVWIKAGQFGGDGKEKYEVRAGISEDGGHVSPASVDLF